MTVLEAIERPDPALFLSVGMTLKHCLSFPKIQLKAL